MPPKRWQTLFAARGGGYTNASEVVHTALRHMQEQEARHARLARPEADDILAELSAEEIAKRARAGFAAIERGEFTDYIGRQGLARLSAHVKARGRKLLAKTQPGT